MSGKIVLPAFYAERPVNGSSVTSLVDITGLYADSNFTTRVGTSLREIHNTMTPKGLVTFVQVTYNLEDVGTVSFSTANRSDETVDIEYATGTGSKNFAFYTPLVTIKKFNNETNEIQIVFYPLINSDV